MKKKFKFGVIGALSLAIASSFIAPNVAKAGDLDPHSYWLGRTQNLPTHGTYFVSQNTGEDISSYNGYDFMTKEQWLNFSGSNTLEWIESGTINGWVYTGFGSGVKQQAYKGGFVGYNACYGVSASQCNSFVQFKDAPLGNSGNLTGKHSYIIRKARNGSGFWDCYMDAQLLISINGNQFTTQEPSNVDLGIESADTKNFYTSGTISYDWWIVDPPNENNVNAGWLPVDSNHSYVTNTGNNYLSGYVGRQYPYNNGTTVPGGAVTASNRFTWYR
ncbi:MAG: hypothetical protein PUP93_14155 [Rhizonema sp. NSF051]|nr:hypothetical protein [Rhizonema sp. NSF051]